MSGAAMVRAKPPSSILAPPAGTQLEETLKLGRKEALAAPAFSTPLLNWITLVWGVFVFVKPPTVNAPPLRRRKVCAVVRFTLLMSRLLVPMFSAALFWIEQPRHQ